MPTTMPTSDLDVVPRVGRARIRDGVFVELDEDMAAVLGRPRDQLVGRHFVSFVGRNDVGRVSERHVRRLRDEAVPSNYETSIVLGDGTERIIEVHVEKRGQDVLVAALDVTARAARSARLHALSALVVAAQREPDAEAVAAHTLRGLAALDMTAVLLRPTGVGLRGALLREAIAVPPALESIAPGLESGATRAAWTSLLEDAWLDGAAWSDDGPKEIAGLLGLGRETVARFGDRSIFRAACLRIDANGTPWALLFTLAGWPRTDDLPALRLFAAQLGAALDSARAIARLSRRNVELAALDRLVAAAGRTTDFAEFIAAALREVVSAVDAASVRLYRLDPRRGGAELLADERGVVDPLDAASRGLDRARLASVLADGASRLAPARDGRGATAEVPLPFRSEPAALLSVDFARGRDVGTAELALLGAMGAHIVSAIEHHALLRDLRGRVDELTLLRDVAVASAELDARRLFENALPRVAATLGADVAYGWVVEEGGELVLQGHVGVPDAVALRVARLAPGEGLPGEAIARLGTVALGTAKTLAPGAPPERPSLFALSSAVAVPLVIGKDRALGAVLLGRTTDAAFSPRECELAEAVAAELAVALESARLFGVTRRRAEDLSLLYELSRSIATTLDVETVLAAGARTLAATVDAPDAYVLLPDATGEVLETRAASGTHADQPQRSFTLTGATPGSMAARAFLSRTAHTADDALTDPRVDPRARVAYEGRAYLAVPLVAHDRAIGAAVIVDTRGPRRFTRAEIERATAVANQLAVGVENARLYDDLRRSYASLGQAQERLVQRERLAALGELAAIVAHEVRNPLGVLFNSFGSLRRLLRPEGEVAMLVDIMDEEAVRLNRIVSDLLDFARPIAPTRAPEALDRVLDEAVQVALTSVEPRAILVERSVEPDLPLVPIDARMLRQAVINLALNALQAMPDGGTLRFRARTERATGPGRPRGVVVEIGDTGVGITREVREKMFEPFFTTKARGSGLGLVVVRRIIEAHHGRVQVDSEPGHGTTFSIFLPLGDGAPDDAAAAPEPLTRAARAEVRSART